MSTPTLQQARSHYEQQRRIALAVLAALRKLFALNPRATVPEITSTAAGYQYASAYVSSSTVAGFADSQSQVIARAFMGVSSHGFSLTEPIIATIDKLVPAPPVAMPAPWWDDPSVFMQALEQLVVSEVQDAGRSASQVEIVARPDWQNYVRMLTPPSCARCAILAGRIYRDLEAFQRHPQCDCVMVPVQSWESAHDAGLVSSPDQAFKTGQIRGLSAADTRAIEDGADISKVVNAARGMTKADMFGHRVKATTSGTTRRSAWRKANPSRLVRLRPESIYQIATDAEDAIRLLRIYGYLTP